MPKKRQQFKQYSKPQSTAPASLSSSSTSLRATNDDQPGRSVNELLADLRRVSLRSQQVPENSSSAFAAPGAPTVPPAIRRILRLPDTPAPPPRRPARLAPNGRRLPPGPAAPRSWLSQSRHAPKSVSGAHVSDSFERHALPGAYAPARRSLVDLVLREIAGDWEFQRSYNRYYLYSLPNHLKVALITYLGVWFANGVSVADLRAILLPCVDEPDNVEEHDDPSTANEDIVHLDLAGSLGRNLRLRELSDLLFRTASPKSPNAAQGEPQESWDTPASQSASSAIPRPLLPNLTHLSLAVNPRHASAVSWRHLLSFSTHFPTLTHLSLAYWPEPSLTPNAKLASFVVATGTESSRTVRYGGTGPYSHSLDDDWSEAVLILRRLSKSLYGLEWLDLTGCGAWATALTATVDGRDFVDWTGDWGKVATVLLYPGYKLDVDAGVSERESYEQDVALAARLERYIRGRRAGKGRSIAVETDAVR